MKPEPGYYAVIFTNQRADVEAGYAETAAHLEALARTMPGYLGFETARGADGFGITVSYWETEEAIRNWKSEIDHLEAQKRGREAWYSDYTVRVARVERQYRMKDRAAADSID